MNKQKIINLMTIVIFLGILFGLAAAFVIKPADDYSSEERRKLQLFPELTWETFKNGDFTKEMNEYLNDQFPLRNTFVGFECDIEKLLLKRENNGVLFGKNDQLAVRLFSAHDGKSHEDTYIAPLVDFFYENHVGAQLNTINTLAERFEKLEIPFSVILPPRTIDVACSAFSYPSENSVKLLEFATAALDDVNYININNNYRARYDNGEYIYYKTDHHWTTLGAYYAYVEVMKSFGMEYYNKADFDIHTAAEDFYGTTYGKSGNKDISPDTVEYWTLKNDILDNYTMEVYTGEKWITFSGFYDFAYLDTIYEGVDKYSMFLSATNPLTLITKKGDEGRETLLLLKDSFGHSLAPFLALHFDLVIVDIGQYSKILSSKTIKNSFEIDKALVCYNIENLVTMNYISKAGNIYKLVEGWENVTD
ncbi:MAG: DHHW family protein [Eubacteriales bacterium]|nr:DHHW family protein [Eubacteriales bacterium]